MLTQPAVTKIYRLLTVDSEYQRKAVERLRLPLPNLPDQHLVRASAPHLPTLEVDGKTPLKRLTMIARDGVIIHTLQAVFPPDESAAVAARWPRNNTATQRSAYAYFNHCFD